MALSHKSTVIVAPIATLLAPRQERSEGPAGALSDSAGLGTPAASEATLPELAAGTGASTSPLPSPRVPVAAAVVSLSAGTTNGSVAGRGPAASGCERGGAGA